MLAFNYNLEAELLALQAELATKTYRPGPYRTFEIVEPKRRMISAAPYRDRVVHHALCNVIAPLIERSFINDSYANRVGKGSHKALERFTDFARSSRYVLQCDIQKYLRIAKAYKKEESSPAPVKLVTASKNHPESARLVGATQRPG